MSVLGDDKDSAPTPIMTVISDWHQVCFGSCPHGKQSHISVFAFRLCGTTRRELLPHGGHMYSHFAIPLTIALSLMVSCAMSVEPSPPPSGLTQEQIRKLGALADRFDGNFYRDPNSPPGFVVVAPSQRGDEQSQAALSQLVKRLAISEAEVEGLRKALSTLYAENERLRQALKAEAARSESLEAALRALVPKP